MIFLRIACALVTVFATSISLFAQNETEAKQKPELPRENITAPEEADMESIFNGVDLNGWDGDPRLWSVVGGAIHGETTKDNAAVGNTFLIWTGGQTSDFELRLSFRCSATNNSGIQYRSRHITENKPKNDWVVRGYQHEIRNEVDFPNTPSFIYDEGGKRGRMCQIGERALWNAANEKETLAELIDQVEFKKLFKLDDWNDVIIRAEGNHLQHYLNGRLVVDFTDESPDLARAEGVLALQLHAGAPMWVEFKNIRFRNLSKSSDNDEQVGDKNESDQKDGNQKDGNKEPNGQSSKEKNGR